MVSKTPPPSKLLFLAGLIFEDFSASLAGKPRRLQSGECGMEATNSRGKACGSTLTGWSFVNSDRWSEREKDFKEGFC